MVGNKEQNPNLIVKLDVIPEEPGIYNPVTIKKAPPPVPAEFQHMLKDKPLKNVENFKKISPPPLPPRKSEIIPPPIPEEYLKKVASKATLIEQDGTIDASKNLSPQLPLRNPDKQPIKSEASLPGLLHSRPKPGIPSRAQRVLTTKFDPNALNLSLIEREAGTNTQFSENNLKQEVGKILPPPLPPRKKMPPAFTLEQLEYNAEIARKHRAEENRKIIKTEKGDYGSIAEQAAALAAKRRARNNGASEVDILSQQDGKEKGRG